MLTNSGLVKLQGYVQAELTRQYAYNAKTVVWICHSEIKHKEILTV